jgi:alkaline phosphatase D
MSLGQSADLFLLDERQYRTVDASNAPVQNLGDRQMQWLIDGLSTSTAQWKVIANQGVIAPMDYGNGPAKDNWGGYPASRTQLLGAIESAGTQNVVFVSGDEHVFMTNLLASDFEAFRSDPAHHPAAVEYVGGSVTSPGGDRVESEVQARNPWTRMYNGANHGYAHLDASATQLVTEYRRSDILDPNGGTFTFERFVQPAGTNTPNRETVQPPA